MLQNLSRIPYPALRNSTRVYIVWHVHTPESEIICMFRTTVTQKNRLLGWYKFHEYARLAPQRLSLEAGNSWISRKYRIDVFLVLNCQLEKCMLFQCLDSIPHSLCFLLRYYCYWEFFILFYFITKQQKGSLISLFLRYVITSKTTLKTFVLRTLVKGSIREL